MCSENQTKTLVNPSSLGCCTRCNKKLKSIKDKTVMDTNNDIIFCNVCMNKYFEC